MTSILPPNSTALERELEALASHVRDLPVPIRTLWNPATCPAAFLPWLAWSWSVDQWRSDWPEATKRAVIGAAGRVHRMKGTRAAVVAAIKALHDDVRVVEWFAEGGSGIPYTARIEAALETGSDIDALTLVRDLVAAARDATSARDRLTIILKSAMGGGVGGAAALAPPVTGLRMSAALIARSTGLSPWEMP